MDHEWAEISTAYRKVYPHCEVCGTTTGTTVHHINGRGAGNGWANLQTLCRTHHTEREWELKRNANH